MADQHDLIVLGSGPAGYYAALEGSRRGLQTALVESGGLGGTGMRTGAVPVKRLLHHCKNRRGSLDYLRRYHPGLAERLETGQAAGKERPREIDMVMEELHADLRRLEESIEGRLRRAGVTLLRGEARFLSDRSVSVAGEEYRGRSFILATGTSPAGYPGIGLDGRAFISHRDLFARSHPCSGDRAAGRSSIGKPAELHGTRFRDTADFDRLIILGGDIEGVEFAQAFAMLGVGVTIVEMESELLPGVDEDLKAPVLRRLAEERVRVVTGRRAVSGGYGESHGQPKRGSSAYKRNGEDGAGEGEARVELDDGSALWADAVLITGSRSLNFPPGLEASGVAFGDGGITVDASLHCSVPGFFAAGEITGRGGPANVAAVQGISAAGEAAAYLYPEAGRDERASTKETGSGEKHGPGGIPGLGQAGQAAPPGAIFTIPEIAGVGANERELRLSGRPYRVRRMELGETWRGFANSVAEGFVKLLLGEEGEILGCWWSAEDAAEKVSMHAISMGTARAPLLDIDALLKAPYIHPTLSEAYRDIFLDNSPR